jgi:hypothetical protein
MEVQMTQHARAAIPANKKKVAYSLEAMASHAAEPATAANAMASPKTLMGTLLVISLSFWLWSRKRFSELTGGNSCDTNHFVASVLAGGNGNGRSRDLQKFCEESRKNIHHGDTEARRKPNASFSSYFVSP